MRVEARSTALICASVAQPVHEPSLAFALVARGDVRCMQGVSGGSPHPFRITRGEALLTPPPAAGGSPPPFRITGALRAPKGGVAPRNAPGGAFRPLRGRNRRLRRRGGSPPRIMLFWPPRAGGHPLVILGWSPPRAGPRGCAGASAAASAGAAGQLEGSRNPFLRGHRAGVMVVELRDVADAVASASNMCEDRF